MTTPIPPVDAFAPPPTLAPHLRRLGFLTGFVTCLYPTDDPRALALSRIHHVARVAALADFVGRQLHVSVASLDRISWLAWTHDINRWPFAQNSEKGRFDQAADIARFLYDQRISADDTQLHDLVGIIDKQVDTISEEAKIVLLADIVAGFVEDPLWALTVIDLQPSFIPSEVAVVIGLPLDKPEFTARLLHLSLLLYRTREPSSFITQFHGVFLDIATRFIVRHGWTAMLPFGTVAFEDTRTLIKERFMRQVLFPYNNEKVSKGAALRERLIKPILLRLGPTGPAVLTQLDEPQFMRMAVDMNIIEEREIPDFYPDLDYVSSNEPENSFRLHSRD
jgi:hypothetical protein